MDYEDSLSRAFDETGEPTGPAERFSIPTPVVRQEGSTTVYENFQATADGLDRSPRHLLKFLQTELGTAAQIDESGRARLTGSFDAARVESVLEAYADTYVLCPECGLPDTHLVEEDDATFLHCDACGAHTPVPS